MLKKRGDWAFTEGINDNILHVCIEQPYEERNPGLAAEFGAAVVGPLEGALALQVLGKYSYCFHCVPLPKSQYACEPPCLHLRVG